MEPIQTVRFRSFRFHVIVLLLLMLSACGPRDTINRVDESMRDPTRVQASPVDPQQYQVRGYGTIDLHRESLPRCSYDTIRTVVTGESSSREEATEALVDLAVLHRGRAVIHVMTESLVVRTRSVSTYVKPGKDPVYDADHHLISRGGLPQTGTRTEWMMIVKYKCRGTVVRFREGC